MKPRDNQRQRVYNSELIGWEIGSGSVREVQAWVDEITASKWWLSRGGYSHISVHDGRRRRRGCASGNVIKLPRFARTKAYTLHELAHVLTRGNVADHGPEFVGSLLALQRRFLGEEAYQKQREKFRAARVRMGKMPRPRSGFKMPALRCHACGRSHAEKSSWQLGPYDFCTKRCALGWAHQNVRRPAA